MDLNQFVEKGCINALNCFGLNPSGLKGTFVFIQSKYSQKTVYDYILSKTKCSKEKLYQSFQFVNLDESISKQKINSLSLSEKLKIELAIALILNQEEIVLYQFDKYFMEKDLQFFKRLLKKLVVKYHKTVVLIDSDFSFMLDFVDRLVVLTDEKEMKVFSKDGFYHDDLNNLIKIPAIVDFVKYVNRDKKILNHYTDIKELIKAIYREV